MVQSNDILTAGLLQVRKKGRLTLLQQSPAWCILGLGIRLRVVLTGIREYVLDRCKTWGS